MQTNQGYGCMSQQHNGLTKKNPPKTILNSSSSSSYQYLSFIRESFMPLPPSIQVDFLSPDEQVTYKIMKQIKVRVDFYRVVWGPPTRTQCRIRALSASFLQMSHKKWVHKWDLSYEKVLTLQTRETYGNTGAFVWGMAVLCSALQTQLQFILHFLSFAICHFPVSVIQSEGCNTTM